MQEAPNPTDETFEARAATILALRGLGLALVAGVLWHLPAGHWIPGLVAKFLAVLAAIWAIVPLAPAGMVYRNILGRRFGLWERRKTVAALGIGIVALLLALAAAVFRLAGSVYG